MGVLQLIMCHQGLISWWRGTKKLKSETQEVTVESGKFTEVNFILKEGKKLTQVQPTIEKWDCRVI